MGLVALHQKVYLVSCVWPFDLIQKQKFRHWLLSIHSPQTIYTVVSPNALKHTNEHIYVWENPGNYAKTDAAQHWIRLRIHFEF